MTDPIIAELDLSNLDLATTGGIPVHLSDAAVNNIDKGWSSWGDS